MPCTTKYERYHANKRYTVVFDEDGTKRIALLLPINIILKITKDVIRRPETNEDWKYYVHLYGGPKPSHIERVEIKPCGTMMAMMWVIKNGLPKEQKVD